MCVCVRVCVHACVCESVCVCVELVFYCLVAAQTVLEARDWRRLKEG